VQVSGTNTRVDIKLKEQLNACKGRLSTHRNGQPHKSRVYHMLPGLGSKHNLGVYNNNVNAVERAFIERYFLCKYPNGYAPAIQPRTHAFGGAVNKFREELLTHLPTLPVLTLAQTVNLFPANKRKVYQRAHEELSRVGFSPKDARLKSFVKFEKQDVSKAPRIINPRSPKYNLLLARYLKHSEHKYFKAINKCFRQRTRATVFKGMDAAESAQCLYDKWKQFKEPVAIGLDATKFDMHVSREALQYEHSFYLKSRFMTSSKQELRDLLRLQLDNTGTARCDDGKV